MPVPWHTLAMKCARGNRARPRRNQCAVLQKHAHSARVGSGRVEIMHGRWRGRWDVVCVCGGRGCAVRVCTVCVCACVRAVRGARAHICSGVPVRLHTYA